jgi:hypothetical protein
MKTCFVCGGTLRYACNTYYDTRTYCANVACRMNDVKYYPRTVGYPAYYLPGEWNKLAQKFAGA